VPGRAFAFTPDRRLRKHSEFVRAQRAGRRVGTPHFTLLVARQPADPAGTEPRRPRLGLVVGRKVGGAVERNRVKRLCRDVFRTCPDLLPAGVDLVVIARDGATSLDRASLRAEWLAARTLLHRRASEVLSRAAAPPPAAGRP
jgi:ribonuclease P protein component